MSDLEQFPQSLDELLGSDPTFGPVENLICALLKPVEQFVPGLRISPWIENYEAFHTPYVVVRKESGAFASDVFGDPDSTYLQRAVIHIETFTDDPDGDQKGAWLQEILRVRLRTCWKKSIVVPGLGHIGRVRISSPPHRATDWATSTGVVQYANLPKNMHRYEATYGILVRPPLGFKPDPTEFFQESPAAGV